jgi:hypothetical protein
MIDFKNMVNTPITLKLGDREFQAQQLSLRDLFASFEKLVTDREFSNAQRIAATLSGAEKVEFLQRVWRELPTGSALMEKVQEEFRTLSGVQRIIWMGVVKMHPEITLADIEALVTIENLNELTPWIEYLCGLKKKTEVQQSLAGASPTLTGD